MIRLETERLILRELSEADAEQLYLLNLDNEVIQYTGDVPFHSVAEAERFIREYDSYEKHGTGILGVICRESGDFLGWCGIKYASNFDMFDIGFRFFKKHWNHGYATEVARACLDFGFNQLGLNRIIAQVLEENAASLKVLEKMGFTYTRVFDWEGQDWLLYSKEKDYFELSSYD